MDDDLDDPYENMSLVIINGSGMVQCGYSIEDAPRALFPNCYGNPKNPGIMIGGDFKYDFVGDEALAKSGILIIRRGIPIDGSPLNFKYLEKVWHHTFYNELRVTPEEHRCLMTDLPNMDERSRRNICGLLFEEFGVPGLYTSNPSVLSIFSTGEDSGVVVDSGYGGTRIVPVFSGHPIQHAALKMNDPNFELEKMNTSLNYGGHFFGNRFGYGRRRPDPETLGIGGNIITDYLVELLQERKYEMTTTAERYLTADIKEKLCYFSLDYENDLKKPKEEEKEFEYILPDGSKMIIGNQCFRACEIMFKPELLGRKRKTHGIHEFIERSIQKCDDDFKDLSSNNIILTGGNTMFPNFDIRLEVEMKKLTKRKLNIIAKHDRKFGSYLGGIVLCNLSSFDREWISDKEYEEFGCSILERKCPLSFQFNEPELFFSSSDSFDSDLSDRMEFVISSIVSFSFQICFDFGSKINVPHKILML